MKVVDTEHSERGRQRRKSANGRRLHCCCICGCLDVWSKSWQAYYSIKELDDDAPFPKFCSDKCRVQGGPRCRNVSDEMLRKAKDAELREPTLVYREATDREKYRAAQERQPRGPAR